MMGRHARGNTSGGGGQWAVCERIKMKKMQVHFTIDVLAHMVLIVVSYCGMLWMGNIAILFINRLAIYHMAKSYTGSSSDDWLKLLYCTMVLGARGR